MLWFLFYDISNTLKNEKIDKAIKIIFAVILIPNTIITIITFFLSREQFGFITQLIILPFYILIIATM